MPLEPIQNPNDPDGRLALDALVQAGFRPSQVPDAHRCGAERISAVLSLLDHLPEQRSGDLLTQRTLLRIAAQRQQERITQQIEHLSRPAHGGFGLGISIRELLAIAAMLVVMLSLVWPVLENARGSARAIACRQGLATAGMAFASYSSANRGELPATKARLGDPWWLTGQFDDEGYAMSNSAHLFQLVRSGVLDDSDCLNCAENPDAPYGLTVEQTRQMRDWQDGRQASYSYQNMYTTQRPRLNSGPLVAILADKNPFFAPGQYRFALGQTQRDVALSTNHSRRQGQNALLSDGRVIWLTSPRLDNGDNIYHAGLGGLDNYTGLEAPSDISDSFLVW